MPTKIDTHSHAGRLYTMNIYIYMGRVDGFCVWDSLSWPYEMLKWIPKFNGKCGKNRSSIKYRERERERKSEGNKMEKRKRDTEWGEKSWQIYESIIYFQVFMT